MPSLQERLGSILRDVLPVEDEPDGGLTVHHDTTFASLRVVNIAEGLDLVSLTQIVAWDLPLTKKLSDQVAKLAHDSNFGNVTMVEKVSLLKVDNLLEAIEAVLGHIATDAPEAIPVADMVTPVWDLVPSLVEA